MKTFNYHSTNLFYENWNITERANDDQTVFTQEYIARLDANGDGYTDLITFPNQGNAPLRESFHNKPLVWVWNASTGTYEEKGAEIMENHENSNVYAFPRDMMVGDFDGDGDDDAVVVDPGFENPTLYPTPDQKPGSELHFIENTASGLRWADGFFGSDTRAYNHIADFFDYDRDGDLDIATATFGYQSSSEAAVIHENNGDGTWTTHDDLFQGNAAKPTSGTGFVELANGNTGIALGFYANENANTANEIWEYNPESQQFEFSSRYDQLPRRGAVDHYNIDVNNDGLKDLIVIYEAYWDGGLTGSPDYYQVLLQNDRSEFVEHQVFPNTQDAVSGHLQFDDLNQDGYIDFIIDKRRIEFHNDSEWQQAHEVFWLNNGDGSFRQATNTNFSFTPVDGEFAYSENGVQLTDGVEEHNLNVYHDVNNDGLVDLIQLGQETPVDTGWWEMNVGERATVYLGSLTMQQLVDDVEHEPLSSDQGWVVKLIDTLFTDQEQQQFGLVQTGVDFLNQGMSKQEIAAAAASFTSGDDSSVLMQKIWKELFGTEISTGDLAYWSNAIDSGVYSQGDIALLAVDYYNLGTASLSNLFYG